MGDSNGVRVVLADDAVDIRRLLKLMLDQDPDFHVVGEAGTGQEAVDLVLSKRPDLVILDLAMPEMDGLEALRRIKSEGDGTKIVILSGFEAAHLANEAMQRGADAYVTKGTKPRDLIARLREVVRGNGGPAPSATTSTSKTESRPEEDLGAVLSVVTHELRNQATVIEGMTSTILASLRDLPLDTIESALQSVVRNASQMHGLVDALADVRHVQTKDLPLLLKQTNVSELVTQTVRDISTLAAGHRIEVEATDDAWADVDTVRIRQILTNLISNAAKFSPDGMTIKVRVSADDGSIRIAVSDQGPGISSENAERLFKPFSRLNRDIPGTGLGLYISRGIAQAHGGDLELAESERGATFVLSLPKVAPQK